MRLFADYPSLQTKRLTTCEIAGSERLSLSRLSLAIFSILTTIGVNANAAESPDFAALEKEYAATAKPLIKTFCLECHSTTAKEGELDLERFTDLKAVRADSQVWMKVTEMIGNGEMPPADSAQPTREQRAQLADWLRRYLDAEALASAGDPGPVILRRLNNAELTYTIQDLTGVPLEPAKEFPVDGAAGEGFTNTGAALVMSPSLVTRYIDAAREISSHAILLPDGIRFSNHKTRNDWTNDALDRIRGFYRRSADHGGGEKVNLQGIVFDTNEGGRLPVEKYIQATLRERSALQSGKTTLETVAKNDGLNERYLKRLWELLNPSDGVAPGSKASGVLANQPISMLLKDVQTRWASASPEDAAGIAERIHLWQQALWKFTTVGHIGKLNGPKAWMEPASPLTSRQEVRLPVPVSENGKDIILYLGTSTAGDGSDDDQAIWEKPRFVAAGRPDLMLKDLRSVVQKLDEQRTEMFRTVAGCLDASAEALRSDTAVDAESLAQRHKVSKDILRAWLQYLGIGMAGSVTPGTLLTGKTESQNGYEFVKGWVGNDALSAVANSSDQHVRVPGNMKPHSIAVHPTPTLSIGTAWRSPVAASLTIQGTVQHAHPECGNGVEWSLELRRGNTRQPLAKGTAHGATPVTIGPLENTAVIVGDVISLVISPRDGNHSCDLTAIDLTLKSASETWDLATDVSPNILAGNPHADQSGRPDIWTFYSEPVGSASGPVIPAGSLLARWQAESSPEKQHQLAEEIQKLLQNSTPPSPDTPDGKLAAELTSLSGPLMSAALMSASAESNTVDNSESEYGLSRTLFGAQTNGSPIDTQSLHVKAPAVLSVRIPADLVAGTEFVTAVSIAVPADQPAGENRGSVQLRISTTEPDMKSLSEIHPASATVTAGSGPWTSNLRGVTWGTPVIVAESGSARAKMETAFEDFRTLFPAALCYTKIVPVDEVVTLTLFYREDEHLQKLMLTEAETAELNRLWDELHYVSRDALTLVDAFAQLMEYATQDADPKVFEPLRGPINQRAEEFRQLMLATEPLHLDWMIQFADRAYRRPLTESESKGLRELYADLRRDEIPHEDAIRTLMTRVLVSPSFLYKLEQPAEQGRSAPVNNHELASRLSYFLWSSMPDDELRRLADSGKLTDPEVLTGQVRRMIKDDRIRRLSAEFACQWLHISDFDQLDEKSERHFPTFTSVRKPMHEEAIRFFEDLFREDRSVLNLYNADYTFLNATLAEHYGIPGVEGDNWRRVDGVQKFGRGGILTLGATLTKQSGASRTSPILRGNWLSEVLLGEKLPKPPKGVPLLPEDESGETLTVRQLVEKHTENPKCYGCHQRIDPYGFALEGYDAIGRARTNDLSGRSVDTKTRVMDGTEVDGIEGLRKYLLTSRRDAVLRQFCRKLLGYSLGREVRLSDQPLLTQMMRELEKRDYHVSVIVEAIVTSSQFREIRSRDALPDVAESVSDVGR